MNLAGSYPTGADYEIYVTDPLDIYAGETDNRIVPDFGELEPLDVSTISLVEDGSIIPLYDVAQSSPHHFAYSRRLINGTLNFNYSEDYMIRFRNPEVYGGRLQAIQDKTLWVRLSYTDIMPMRRVRDTYRIGSVYEHPFSHQPQPQSSEQVPFTARDLTLIMRESADLNEDVLGAIVEERDQQRIRASEVYRNVQQKYSARITRVIDGDTFEAQIKNTGRQVTIRLPATDTPESSSSSTPNRAGEDGYTWPNSAPKNAGQAPSPSQLDRWGDYVKARVTEWIEGKEVWLQVDLGAAPEGNFGRSIYRVDMKDGPIEPDYDDANIGPDGEGHINVSRSLIDHGYAELYAGRSIGLDENGQYQDEGLILRNIYDARRETAGTENAAGIWYSFDVEEWEDAIDSQTSN